MAEITIKGSLSPKQRTPADLMDRAWRRPAQAVIVSGARALDAWQVFALDEEEFAKLAELSAKALGPAHQDTSQNGCGFEEKSTVAIEAESLEPEA